MKSPLRYENTEDDCGEVSIFNGISFLFEKEEMPLELIRIIASYSIGCYDDFGNLLNNDFSQKILFFFEGWINRFAKDRKIPLKAKLLLHEDVDVVAIRKSVLSGGCVILKTQKQKPHYVLVTDCDSDEMFIFDPSFLPEGSYLPGSGIGVNNNNPFKFNRRVRIEHFISEKRTGLTLGPENLREAVLLQRDDSILQREFD